jgi:hypothetical protein
VACQRWRCLNRLITIATPRSCLIRPALISPQQVPSFRRQAGKFPFFLQEVSAESDLSASRPQAYDYPPSSSHPSGQTATDSFSPRSQNKSFLRRVLGKRSGNRDDPTATDEFGERSNPDASTASVFGKIREPGTGRPPTENWNPYGPIAEAIRKSITVSVSGAIMKEELDSGRQTNSVTSRQDEMAGHYRVLEEVHEELDTLLDLEDPQPTRERYLDCVREKSGNQDHDVRRHGRTWDKSVGRRARRDGWI